jgi:hypothetical protein
MNSKFDVTLHCKLRKILEDRDVSIKKLSEQIGERRLTISEVVNNKEITNKRLPVTLVAKLLVYFNVKFEDLFEVVPNNEKPPNE